MRRNLDGIAGIRPGLATKWWIDEQDKTKWIFKLRQGVKFHDGTPLTVDAVFFNLGRIFDDKSPQFDAPASPIVRSQISMLDRWEKIDDETFAMYTKTPFAFFPYVLTRMLIVSPTQWEKSGRNWPEFAKQPAGTGPFKIAKVNAVRLGGARAKS